MTIRWPWHYLREAREHLAKVERDDDRVNEVAQKAQRIKTQNGFLSAIDSALGGQK